MCVCVRVWVRGWVGGCGGWVDVVAVDFVVVVNVSLSLGVRVGFFVVVVVFVLFCFVLFCFLQ